MPLRPLSDLSPADWFSRRLTRRQPRARPARLRAYVRVLHPATHDGEDRIEGHLEDELLPRCVDVLARHTAHSGRPATSRSGTATARSSAARRSASSRPSAGRPRWPRSHLRPRRSRRPSAAGVRAGGHGRSRRSARPRAPAVRRPARRRPASGEQAVRPRHPSRHQQPQPHVAGRPRLVRRRPTSTATWTGVGGSAALADDLLADAAARGRPHPIRVEGALDEGRPRVRLARASRHAAVGRPRPGGRGVRRRRGADDVDTTRPTSRPRWPS